MMTNLYYDVKLDIQKDTVFDAGFRFTQGDSKVMFLRITVTNGNEIFDSNGTTQEICFVKADGTCVVGTPIKNGDFWLYQFLGNELQFPGKVLCDMKFIYESGRVSSSKFTFMVERDTTSLSPNASASYIAPMEEMLGEMTNYKNQGISLVEAASDQADRAEKAAEEAEKFTPPGYNALVDRVIDLGNNKADKGTTLLDYGINDAYTKTEVDDLLDGLASDWDSVTDKPFDVVGDDFKVVTNDDNKKELALGDDVRTELDGLRTDIDTNTAKLSDNADFLKSQVIDFPITYRSGHLWTDESNALYGCIYIQAEPNTTYYVTISNIKGSVRIFTKSAIASFVFGTYVDYQNNVSIETDSTNTMLCIQFNVSSGTITEQDLINANVQVSTSVIAMSNVEITEELNALKWRKIGNYVGAQTINLPSGWNELMFIRALNNLYNYSSEPSIIPRVMVNAGFGGTFTVLGSQETGVTNTSISNDTFEVKSAMYATSDVSSAFLWSLYYR